MDNLFGTEVAFDNVKYEKEKAMQRFNKLKRLKKILKVFEFVFGFLLLIWSTKKIPSTVGFSGKVFEFLVYFLNPHFVFLIGNSIIFAVFLLCKHHGTGNSSQNGIYGEYSCQNEASEVSLTYPLTFGVEVTAPVTHEVALTFPLTYRVELTSPLTCPEVVVAQVEEENGELEKEELSMVVAENDECEAAAQVAVAAAEQEIRMFERTLSEKLKTEIGLRQRKELRRSETDNGRPTISGGGGGGGGGRRMMKSTFKTVEHLTNEEFKLAIDAFIDEHKVFFKEQINDS